jgi:hypothetical protein
MAMANYYILLNKNGNLITTDYKLPIYWSKEVALRDKEKYKAYKIVSIKRRGLRNLFEPSATAEYLENNVKNLKLKEGSGKFEFNIYYSSIDGGFVRMKPFYADSYKEAKLDFFRCLGKDVIISHYEKFVNRNSMKKNKHKK